MERRLVRAALSETCSVYPDMPDRLDALGSLAGKLEDIRRANVVHHLELMEAAKAQGVQVICFGELFPAPYFALGTDPLWLALAETVEGKTVGEVREAARR
ncbi:hypothetical protein ABS71_10695 [bacterium SCN 62-11]|nr:MAG: hypothetical protein ABS71_10695 [bacterium SCN 62-11]